MNNTKLAHSEHLVKVNVTHHSNARTRKFSIKYENNKKYKQWCVCIHIKYVAIKFVRTLIFNAQFFETIRGVSWKRI